MIRKCPDCGEQHDDAISCLEHLGVDPDAEQLADELAKRAKRIDALVKRGATWNGTCYGLNENGKSTFYDADGCLL